MEVPAGQRNQYLVDVILEKEEREILRKLIQETVREELKSEIGRASCRERV